MNRGRAFLLVLLAIVSVAVFVIVLPFLEYVLLALIVAYILYPLHVRLVSYVESFSPLRRFSQALSALVLMTASVLALILPLLYILLVFVRDLRAMSRGEIELRTGVTETRFAELTGRSIDIEAGLSLLGEWVLALFFGDVAEVLSVVLQVSPGVALVLFLVFYLLLEGPALVSWLAETSPLSPEVSDTLIAQVDRTTWGAVIGHTFAAIVQGLVAGLGLYLAGIPKVGFWTIVMVVLAFLPLIGVFLVWAPAAAYLFMIGETTSGLLLAAYGLTVVSFIDYYARPIVIDQRAGLNPAVILVGVFGGIFTLGFVGLFVGPILIGVLVAIVETFRVEYQLTPSAEDATMQTPARSSTEAPAEVLEDVNP